MSGCDRVPFEPTIDAQPSTSSAESPTGLKAVLEIPDDGIHPKGLTQSTLKKAIVKLPEGVTLNPSAGEGLGYCTPRRLRPRDARHGTGRGLSELIEARLDPHRHAGARPAGGRLALHRPNRRPLDHDSRCREPLRLAARDVHGRPRPGARRDRRAEAKVVPDPKTGQLVTTFDDLPPLPFSKFIVAFREGARAPLATPPNLRDLHDRHRTDPVVGDLPGQDVFVIETPFEVEKRRRRRPLPRPEARRPSTRPAAGTLNNAAGNYSPFNVRLTRNDGEQEFTNFSIKLPPGVDRQAGRDPLLPRRRGRVARKARPARRSSPARPARPPPRWADPGRRRSRVGRSPTCPARSTWPGPTTARPSSIAAITAAKVGPVRPRHGGHQAGAEDQPRNG